MVLLVFGWLKLMYQAWQCLGKCVHQSNKWSSDIYYPSAAQLMSRCLSCVAFLSSSIGDEVSQTVGVISVPEVIPHQISSNDIFAVWASDGEFAF